MPYALTLLVAPATEPVSLAEAKDHLYIASADTAWDESVSRYLAESRSDAETETGRTLAGPATWLLVLDGFPPYFGEQAGFWGCRPMPCLPGSADTITLPLPPCRSVTGVRYYDSAGVQRTLDPSQYYAALRGEPGRLLPVRAWPLTQYRRPESVEIEYVAGPTPGPGLVHRDIVAAIKLILGDRWANRGDDQKPGISGSDRQIPPAAVRLLRKHQVQG